MTERISEALIFLPDGDRLEIELNKEWCEPVNVIDIAEAGDCLICYLSDGSKAKYSGFPYIIRTKKVEKIKALA